MSRAHNHSEGTWHTRRYSLQRSHCTSMFGLFESETITQIHMIGKMLHGSAEHVFELNGRSSYNSMHMFSHARSCCALWKSIT